MANTEVQPVINRVRTVGIAALIIGAIGMAMTFAQGREEFLRAYLFGYSFWINLSIGCLGLAMLQYMLRANWGLPVLRFLEAGGSWKMFAMLAVLFIPIFLGREVLYPWASPEYADDKIVQWKTPYLNLPFWTVRTVLYFLIWGGLAFVLMRSSARQDQNQDPGEANKRANIAAPGTLVFVLAVTFAFTDWVMATEAHWFSTIYGVLFLIGQALAALTFAIVMLGMVVNKRPFSNLVNVNHFHDLGKLLLAFVMFWTYINLSQFLIMWSGNIPEETTYYLARRLGIWGVLGGLLFLLQFFLPFIALLSARTKRHIRLLTTVAWVLVIVRVLDVLYVVTPSAAGHHAQEHAAPVTLAHLFIFLGIGGLWLTLYALQLRADRIVPTFDPRLQETSLKEASAHV